MGNRIRRTMGLAIALAMLLSCAAMAEAADGVYTGVGQGNHGDVVVETTIEGGVITSVVVTEARDLILNSLPMHKRRVSQCIQA